jgi:hypothetical protein
MQSFSFRRSRLFIWNFFPARLALRSIAGRWRAGGSWQSNKNPNNPVHPACPPISLEGLKTFFVKRIKLVDFYGWMHF